MKAKHKNCSIEFTPDDYTFNEVNIWITDFYQENTMVTKGLLKEVGKRLKEGAEKIISNELNMPQSQYTCNPNDLPLIEIEKQKGGFSFKIKAFIGSAKLFLPNRQFKKVVDFMCKVDEIFNEEHYYEYYLEDNEN